MSDKVMHANDTNFEELMSSSTNPVMVDFWAPWCGPCRMLGPIFDNMAEKYSDKITFIKVNVDECPSVATQYQISGIPNIKVFKEGQEVNNMVGVQPPEEYSKVIEELTK